MTRDGGQKSLLGTGPDGAGAIPALEIIRIVVALLILIHGAARLAAGGVVPFGTWLESIGFPVGIAFASAVTAYELIAPLLILARRFVTLMCIGHIGILFLGMILVHLPAGWFVVGLGRNGMEYSVLLIAVLGAVAWAYRPATKT
jgi:putative oxidoreductase